MITDYFPDTVKSNSVAVTSVSSAKKKSHCTDKKCAVSAKKPHIKKEKEDSTSKKKSPKKKEAIEIDLDSKEESNHNDDPDLSISSMKDSKSPRKKPFFDVANEEYQKQMRRNINPVSYIGKKKETTLENTVSPRLEGDKEPLEKPMDEC